MQTNSERLCSQSWPHSPQIKYQWRLTSSSIIINTWAAVAAKSLQLCPTLCDPIDGSPPGSAVPGIFQARTLEWVAISFSNAWKWKVKVKSLSHVQLLVTPWTAAYQAPLSMGFSRQEYRSGVPLPSLNTWAIFRFVVDLWNIAQTNLCTITIKCRIRSSIYKYR